MLSPTLIKYALQSPLYREWLIEAENVTLFKDQTETQIDEFTREELLLAASLGSLFLKETKEIKDEFSRLLKTRSFTIRDVKDILDDLERVTVVSREKKADLKEFILDLIKKSGDTALDFSSVAGVGALTAGLSMPVEETNAAHKFSTGMSEFGTFYANNYGSRILSNDILTKVESLLALPEAERQAALAAVRSEINTKFTANPYWKTVSNQIAAKSYHYGYLKQLDAMGESHYTYKAVMDDRTTEICRHLNGKVFHIKTSIKLLETFSESDPLTAKGVMPWLDSKQQKHIVNSELSVDELQAHGVAIPGTLHANCRSTLIDAYGRVIAGGLF